MAILIECDDCDECTGIPHGDVMCSECHAVFDLQWKRSSDIDGVRFCPFCGDEIEDELTEQ